MMWRSVRIPIDVFCSNDSEAPPADFGPVGFSPEEVDQVGTMMQEFIELGLLPHMERKVRAVYHTVSTKTKGQLKKMLSWFGGPSKGDAPAPESASAKFPLDSYEMQTRKLADLLFLLRDYTQVPRPASPARPISRSCAPRTRPPPPLLRVDPTRSSETGTARGLRWHDLPREGRGE